MADAPYVLTGLDINDPTPGFRRELKTNRGKSSGSARQRDVVILGNKLSTVGSGSVDGRGDSINFPVLISDGRQEVIERFGEGSELLNLYDAYVTGDPEGAVYLCCVAPGTGSGTFDLTIANNSNKTAGIKISLMGETVTAAIASGDTPTTMATEVARVINTQQHWPVSATSALGVVTVTSKMAGTRHDHFLNRMRFAFTRPQDGGGTTLTKGAVTPGSADDDQTTAITNLDSEEIYYQVNPKSVTSGVSATDNGIGEHLAMINASRLPSSGRDQVLIAAGGGTAAQASTVAVSMNSEWAFYAHAEDNDFSPGMVAAQFAGILARAERSDPAANLTDYGIREPSAQPISVPDPFDKTDRHTALEIKTLLNNGVTPIAFTSTGKAYIVRHVTTRSETSAIKDYRARSGHIPSAITDTSQRIATAINAIKQPKKGGTLLPNQKPQAGFSYTQDYISTIGDVIDVQCDRGILDPEKRAEMKASIDIGDLPDGYTWRVQVEAVKHNNRNWMLLEEVSPPA